MAFFCKKKIKKIIKNNHFLDESDFRYQISISKCDHLAEIFQKLRILGGTIFHLAPKLILEYLAVSTEFALIFYKLRILWVPFCFASPSFIYWNFVMKLTRVVVNIVIHLHILQI